MSEEHEVGHLQDSSEDEEEVDWKDLNEETTVEDLMDRYAAGTIKFISTIRFVLISIFLESWFMF